LDRPLGGGVFVSDVLSIEDPMGGVLGRELPEMDLLRVRPAWLNAHFRLGHTARPDSSCLHRNKKLQ